MLEFLKASSPPPQVNLSLDELLVDRTLWMELTRIEEARFELSTNQDFFPDVGFMAFRYDNDDGWNFIELYTDVPMSRKLFIQWANEWSVDDPEARYSEYLAQGPSAYNDGVARYSLGQARSILGPSVEEEYWSSHSTLSALVDFKRGHENDIWAIYQWPREKSILHYQRADVINLVTKLLQLVP